VWATWSGLAYVVFVTVANAPKADPITTGARWRSVEDVEPANRIWREPARTNSDRLPAAAGRGRAGCAQDVVRRSSQLLPAGSAQNITVTLPRPPDR
jgi:hypothetical protein